MAGVGCTRVLSGASWRRRRTWRVLGARRRAGENTSTGQRFFYLKDSSTNPSASESCSAGRAGRVILILLRGSEFQRLNNLSVSLLVIPRSGNWGKGKHGRPGHAEMAKRTGRLLAEGQAAGAGAGRMSMLEGPRILPTRPSSTVKLNCSRAKCFSRCRNSKYSGLPGSLYVMILAA